MRAPGAHGPSRTERPSHGSGRKGVIVSKQYTELARKIVDAVGGPENVESLHHCQTRLRFKLRDFDKASVDEASKLDGVMQVLVNGGMFQVVIGMQVAEVYEEVVPLLGSADAAPAAGDEASKKQSAFDIVADFVSSIFSPIVPALAGAGMVKALLSLLVAFELVDTTSQTYTLVNMFGDAMFAFMPILLAFSTAKKLGSNQYLAAVTAGIMCHATWTGMVSAGEPVMFFGVIPFYLVKYTSSVIPIVLVMLVQAPLEKWLNKHVPGAIRLVLVPMIVFFVMGTLALSILGPLGDYVGTAFTAIFVWLSENVSWAPSFAIAAVYPVLVLFGLHHGLAPLGTMQMAQMGYDSIFGPGVLCSNVSQGVASLVTGIISRDDKDKQIGISAGITGLMGTTEPALYGINFPKRYPLIASLIGGACGGFFAGLTQTHRFATGSSGLPAVVMYLGDNTTRFFIQIIVALAISIVVTAIMTVVLAKVFGRRGAEKNAEPAPGAPDTTAPAAATPATEIICAPVSGTARPLTESADPVFSSESLGKGAAIDPTDDTVYSPAAGTVSALFPTNHAIGITTDSGAEILIHLGINTVELEGRHFEAFVTTGERVSAGQKLVAFDRTAIEKEGYNPQVMVIVTNTAAYADVNLLAAGTVSANAPLVELNVE